MNTSKPHEYRIINNGAFFWCLNVMKSIFVTSVDTKFQNRKSCGYKLLATGLSDCCEIDIRLQMWTKRQEKSRAWDTNYVPGSIRTNHIKKIFLAPHRWELNSQTHKQLVVAASRGEGIYNRTDETSVTSVEEEERESGRKAYFLPQTKNKPEPSELCSDVCDCYEIDARQKRGKKA